MRGTRVHIGVGPILAAAAAGPAFVLLVLFAAYIGSLPEAVPIEPSGVGLLFAILIPAQVLGFVISIAPNFLGAAILGHLGRAALWARTPATWALTGGLVIGVPMAMAGGFSGEEGRFGWALVGTGALCALICRRGASWDEGGRLLAESSKSERILRAYQQLDRE